MSTKPKTAALTGGLVAKKGAAAPSAPQAAVKTPKDYKALTLKVNIPNYRKLKTLGLALDMSSQELLTEALDDLFKKHA